MSDCDVLLNLRKKGSNFTSLIWETIGPAASQDVIKVKYLKVQHSLAKRGAVYDCTRKDRSGGWPNRPARENKHSFTTQVAHNHDLSNSKISIEPEVSRTNQLLTYLPINHLYFPLANLGNKATVLYKNIRSLLERVVWRKKIYSFLAVFIYLLNWS